MYGNGGYIAISVISKAKTHHGGAKIVVRLCCVLGYPSLNFNHVIINNDFHKKIHIIIGQNTKKIMRKKLHFLISYDVML